MLHMGWVVIAFIATVFYVRGSVLPVSDYLFVVIIKKKNIKSYLNCPGSFSVYKNIFSL